MLGLMACGGSQKQNVKAFVETFTRYAGSNHLDSIRTLYPTANFDSIVQLPADSISISEAGEGLYKINFSGSQWIEVKVGEDGNMTIVASGGVAAFPKERYNLAMSTGMLNDTLTDVKVQQLLNDTAYFDWLQKTYLDNTQYKIKVTPGKYKSIWKNQWGEASKGTMTITVTNLTDTPISGSDYSIAYKTYESNGYTDDSQRFYTRNNTIKGKDLGPKESQTIPLSKWETYKFHSFTIIPVRGKEDQLTYRFTPTGKEYQEYIEGLKENSNANYDWLSTRSATAKDLENKSKEQLRIMRNWIYARHGYIFKSEDLTEYFSKLPWYKPTSRDVNSELTKIERANVALIQQYE